MAEEKKYKDATAAVLKADSLKRLYDVLESEETPFGFPVGFVAETLGFAFCLFKKRE